MDLAMIILVYNRASTVIVLIANPKAVATASPISSDCGISIRVAIKTFCPKSRERMLMGCRLDYDTWSSRLYITLREQVVGYSLVRHYLRVPERYHEIVLSPDPLLLSHDVSSDLPQSRHIIGVPGPDAPFDYHVHAEASERTALKSINLGAASVFQVQARRGSTINTFRTITPSRQGSNDARYDATLSLPGRTVRRSMVVHIVF